MRVRGLLAVAAVACAGLLVPPAHAESCGLVQDAENDTAFAGRAEAEGVLVQKGVDILSADVATEDGVLYGTIALQAVESGNLPAPVYVLPAPVTVYRLEFSAGSRKLFLQAWSRQVSPYPQWFEYSGGRVGARSYMVTGSYDREASALRFEVPFGVFGRNTIKPGTTFSGFRVTAVRTYSDNGQVAPGVATRVSVSDVATSTATYVTDTDSCLLDDGEE